MPIVALILRPRASPAHDIEGSTGKGRIVTELDDWLGSRSQHRLMSNAHPTVRGRGPIATFMSEEHARIDELLEAAQRWDAAIELAVYAEFRGALLRHMAMEEKVLLPFARARRAGEPLDIAPRLRADHGELAKLLVRSPSESVLESIRAILSQHNAIEEGPAGLYASCDDLAGSDAAGTQLVAQLQRQPVVPLAPYYYGPLHRRG